MNIFLYGSMCYEPILTQIMGHVPVVSPAVLEGAVIVTSDDGRHASLCSGGEIVDGLLLRDITSEAEARVVYYAEALGYHVAERQVSCGSGVVMAKIFSRSANEAAALWDENVWRARWADVMTRAAEEAMGYFGQYPADYLVPRYGQIAMRAATRIGAQKDAVPYGLSSQDVEIVSTRRPYMNFFMLEEVDLKHRKYDGSLTDTITRAAFVGGDAAILLPYDPVRDRVLVVEQFRTPPLVRGDPAPWLIEAIAGRVDPGETPEDAAHREAWEEARLTLRTLERVGRAYPTPGSSTEFFHLFVGLADLPDDAATVAGLEDEDEDIRSHVMSFDDLMMRVDAHEIRVEPLLTCALWLARHRDRLRRGG